MNKLLAFRHEVLVKEIEESLAFKMIGERITSKLKPRGKCNDTHMVSPEWVSLMKTIYSSMVLDEDIHTFVSTMAFDETQLEYLLSTLPNSIHTRCLIYGTIQRGILYPMEDAAGNNALTLTHDLLMELNPADRVDVNLYLLVLINIYLNNLNYIN